MKNICGGWQILVQIYTILDKLTQNQELWMKVIVLRRKAVKSGFHLNFLFTVIKHPSTLHPFLKI